MFHFNDDQGWMWGEKGKTVIKPKGQGGGIMVSDFLMSTIVILALTDSDFDQGKRTFSDLKKKARIKVKIGAEFKGF